MFKKMKENIISKSFVFLIIFYTIAITTTNTLSHKIEKKLFDSDNNLTPGKDSNNSTEKKYKPDFTEILPDDQSTPLRLSKEQIGRYTWNVLHSIAASFPKEPTNEDKDNVKGLLNTLAALFPCKICSEHFLELLAKNPIKNNSREELVLYVCDLHNQVNKALNKPIFDCEKAMHFWGGDCGCSGESNSKNQKINRIPGENPEEAHIIIENLSSFERIKEKEKHI